MKNQLHDDVLKLEYITPKLRDALISEINEAMVLTIIWLTVIKNWDTVAIFPAIYKGENDMPEAEDAIICDDQYECDQEGHQ